MSAASSHRVVVVGSVNVDLVARVDHLPAAGETVGDATFDRHAGGKGGNQAVAAARLGGRVAFVGAIGDDPLAEEARAALASEGIDLAGLSVIAGPTGVALILVDRSGENAIAVAPGANAALKRPTPRPYPWAAWHQGIRDTERIRRSGESLMKERA